MEEVVPEEVDVVLVMVMVLVVLKCRVHVPTFAVAPACCVAGERSSAASPVDASGIVRRETAPRRACFRPEARTRLTSKSNLTSFETFPSVSAVTPLFILAIGHGGSI